jgi:molybdenum cofactor synthesis domain-containing protein
VLTVSDGVAGGSRQDESGEALARSLEALGFRVERDAVADDMAAIREAIQRRSEGTTLIVATGGTGLGPRDVTPQALAGILDYTIPGFGELMRAAGRRSTAMADLSRSVAGVRGRCLVVAVPGSPSGALESLEALVPLLHHALETLGGETAHTHGGSGAHVGGATE